MQQENARRKKAIYDKARRSTAEYKLRMKQKRDLEKEEEALFPEVAEERKRKQSARYEASKAKRLQYYRVNRERIAARRSTPEMKARKAAYDRARRLKRLGANQLGEENVAI